MPSSRCWQSEDAANPRRVRRGPLAQQVHRVRKDLLAQQAHRGRKGLLDRQVLPGLRVRREILDPRRPYVSLLVRVPFVVGMMKP